MKKANKPSVKETFSSRSSKAGSKSLGITAIVIAAVIAMNVVLSVLPEKYTQLDLTDSGTYTVTQQSVELLKKLDKDVTIYRLCTPGNEDNKMTALLESYASASGHIIFKEVDVVKDTSFASKYTDEEATDNSVVIECGERSRFIGLNDMYEYQMDYSTYSYTTTGFGGENMITNAIVFVTSEDVPTVAYLTGHGEQALEAEFAETVEKSNFLSSKLNLKSEGKIPEDIDCVAIISPTSDITKDDLEVLKAYMDNGGKLLIVTDIVNKEDFPLLSSLLGGWGIEPVEGTIIETDAQHYYAYQGYGSYTWLLPDIGACDITEGFENLYVLIPGAQGFNLSEEAPEGISREVILRTTAEAYSCTDISAKQSVEIDKEKDIPTEDGFILGTAVRQKDSDTPGKAVYYSSSAFMSASVDASVSGANSMLFINSLAWLCDTEDAIAIPVKNIGFETLTIPASSAGGLELLFIAVIPLAAIIAGTVVCVKRKKK